MTKIPIALLLVFLLWGCATSPSEEPAAPPRVVPKELFVEVDLPHLLKETRYFQDGSVNDYTVLSYHEETGRLLTKKTFDSFDNPKEEIYYLYPEEGVERRETRDQGGKILFYEVLRYDEEGRLLSKESTTSQGSFKLSSRYDYDEGGNRILLTVTGSPGAVLSKIAYTFQKDLKVQGVLRGEDGELWNTFVYEYDDQNRLVREVTLNRKGEREKEVIHIYREDFRVIEEHRDGMGVLDHRFRFENDDKGSPVLITMEGSDGAVLATRERSYFYTVEKRFLEEE